MKMVALKGLRARPVRTLLTTLAIVLGVAMVSGALTLTDTMRGGADGLTKAAYDGTDAVVAGKTAFAVDSTDYTTKRPTVDASLLERRHIQGYDVTVLEAVYHVVEHFGMHTGQIIVLTKMHTGIDLRLWQPPAP